MVIQYVAYILFLFDFDEVVDQGLRFLMSQMRSNILKFSSGKKEVLLVSCSPVSLMKLNLFWMGLGPLLNGQNTYTVN